MIKKDKIISPSDTDETKLLLAKCIDLYNKACNINKPFFTKFLTPSDLMKILNRFPKSEIHIDYFGGYDESERCMVVFQNEKYDVSYPVCALKITLKSKTAHLSHRDYLGSLLSLGIKREVLGDIIPCESGAIVFCVDEILEYIIQNTKKIGSCPVNIEKIDDAEKIIVKKDFINSTHTVSSMRCDCVVSSAINLSRTKSAQIIEKGLVSVNYESVLSVCYKIKPGDILTVRGFGKFKLSDEISETKKGKIKLDILKYV